LTSGAKALKVCGIYGTAEAVPFLRISFRTSEIRVRSGRVSVADGQWHFEKHDNGSGTSVTEVGAQRAG